MTPKIGRLRFDEAVADVVTDYKIRGLRTGEDVERRIKLHLEPFFGGRRMVSITTADVRAYTLKRRSPVKHEDGTETPGASTAAVNRELAILKRAFRLAVKGGKLLHEPHIPIAPEHNVRKVFFEREQFEAVRTALPEALRGVVTFGYLTGWRVQIRGAAADLGADRQDRQDDPLGTGHDEERRRPHASIRAPA